MIKIVHNRTQEVLFEDVEYAVEQEAFLASELFLIEGKEYYKVATITELAGLERNLIIRVAERSQE